MSNKQLPLALAASLILAGCGLTREGTFVSDAVKVKGAQVYDAGLDNAEFFICQAASVGSVIRRYGRDWATASAWRTLCEGQDGVNLIQP